MRFYGFTRKQFQGINLFKPFLPVKNRNEPSNLLQEAFVPRARILENVQLKRNTHSILFYSILFYSNLFYSILFYSILFDVTINTDTVTVHTIPGVVDTLLPCCTWTDLGLCCTRNSKDRVAHLV